LEVGEGFPLDFSSKRRESVSSIFRTTGGTLGLILIHICRLKQGKVRITIFAEILVKWHLFILYKLGSLIIMGLKLSEY